MKKNKRNKISLEKIAEACGVSVMTVSRALRRLPGVAPETSRRILAQAVNLGYLPSLSGGRKSSRSPVENSRPVQIIVRELNGRIVRFQAELMLELIRLLAQQNIESLVRVVNGEYSEFLHVLNIAGNCDAAATLLIGAFPEKELRPLLRVIPGAFLLDDSGQSVPDCLCNAFSFNNGQAAELAVKHLVSRGKKRILLVTGPEEHFFTGEIIAGCRNALEVLNIPWDQRLILHTDFSASDAAEKVGAVMDSGLNFDAVFTNDEMAGGVYRAILSRGLTIPGDIAVCGCDGLPIGEQLYPTLTTVKLDYRSLAGKVVEQISISVDCSGEKFNLPAEIVLRNS